MGRDWPTGNLGSAARLLEDKCIARGRQIPVTRTPGRGRPEGRPRGGWDNPRLHLLLLSIPPMALSTWLAFFAASWAISISPGAGALAAMSAGLNHGFRRGYFTTVGLVLGIWTQLIVVAVGLGALVATSSTAFQIVKWGGVAYLVWLGVQQWRAPARPLAAAQAQAADVPVRQMILRGWMINAVNPKGTVFLLAVVPQFLDLHQPLAGQYLVIGLTLSFTDFVVMAGYTALAARVLGALKSADHMRALNRVFGSLFVLAGALLSVFKRTA
jgi:homoserine/homoserine lactone efflux protein